MCRERERKKERERAYFSEVRTISTINYKFELHFNCESREVGCPVSWEEMSSVAASCFYWAHIGHPFYSVFECGMWAFQMSCILV